MRWSRRETAALSAGLVWPFAFAPFGLWPLALLSLGSLFVVLDGTPVRTAAWRAALFGFGMFSVGVWWVFVSMHGFGGLHWTLAAAITVSLVVAKSGFVAAFGALAAWAAPRRHAWARWLLVFPAAWVAVEWLRGWFLSGFPWLLTGSALTDSPLAGWFPVGGTLSVSLAAAVTAGAFGYLLVHRPRWPQSAAVLVVGSSVWLVGAVLDRVEFHRPAGAPLQVALLQGNVSQDLKWDPSQLLPTIRLYDGLNAAHWDADLIVWPEAALPALHHQLTDYLEVLDESATERRTAVVMGMLIHDREDDRYFNAVVGLGDGAGTYAKRHLVPFGEFFPVPPFVRDWLRMMNLPYSDFTRGERDQEPLLVRGHAVAASVCYEVAYGATMARGVADTALLINVSNDAWFGDTIAPHQHLQIARQRAREAGRWMLRATNTGITAVVDPRGRVVATLPQFETGVLRSEIVPMTGATPYSRFRDAPVLALLAAMFALGAGLRFRYP